MQWAIQLGVNNARNKQKTTTGLNQDRGYNSNRIEKIRENIKIRVNHVNKEIEVDVNKKRGTGAKKSLSIYLI